MAPEEQTAEPPISSQGDVFTRLYRLRDPTATEVILVRHGEPTPADRQATVYDPPLSERGRWQARRLAARLAPLRLDALYSSPLKRALQTAQPLAEATGLEIREVPDLREVEMDLARLRSLSQRLGREALIEELGRRLLATPRWDMLPGFEPSHRFRHRVLRAMQEIVSRHPGGRVVVVCHGGVINIYLGRVLGIRSRDIFFLPEFTSLTVVRVAGERAVVQTVGDYAHLAAEGGEIFTAP